MEFSDEEIHVKGTPGPSYDFGYWPEIAGAALAAAVIAFMVLLADPTF